MLDLIKRLENASSGSRELDAEIAAFVHGTATKSITDVRGDEIYRGYKAPDTGHWKRCPHYTTSLDAALTLVLEGSGWDVGFIAANEAPIAHVWRDSTDAEQAVIETDVGKPLPRGGIVFRGKAATPALALVIASLKARKAGGET